MYGLIGKMRTVPGKRDELLGILMEATASLPGCLNYIVARDPVDTTAIWITEVWTDAGSHKASLSTPDVLAAIGRAKPMIAGFEFQVETDPVGGFGLPVG
jgi:quinol monooxygenase YgiN